jgi:flagellar hook-associated protein 3 FlgL
MRVTYNSMVHDYLSGITLTRQRLSKLEMQLATQQRISKPSEDPEATSILLRTDTELGKVDKYAAAITNGKNMVEATASGLDQISTIIQKVKGTLAGGQSETEPDQLARLGDQVDSYLNMALEIANTEYGGKYIFGGTETMTPPYVRSGSAEAVTYNGNASPVEYRVGSGMMQSVSIPGAAAFSSTGVVTLAGSLDRNATIGTSVTNTMTVTDAKGVAHEVQLVFEKTAENTWEVSSAIPPGNTDASGSGGTATITFDPDTGAVVNNNRGSSLTLIPALSPPAKNAAPSMSFMFAIGNLTEQAGVSAPGASSQQVDLFNKLIEIRNSLRSGTMPTADDITMLGMMNESVTREAARAGAYSNALVNAEEYQTGIRERLLDIKGAKQDVDLTEIGIKLKLEQTVLEAALSAAAKIMPKSLMDFLT